MNDPGGHRYFSGIDICDGYGRPFYRRHNSGARFEKMRNDVLCDYLGDFENVYVDDVEYHVSHLLNVRHN